jgi:polysaccharide deacetylase family protein (PEP-CTERM system associated)
MKNILTFDIEEYFQVENFKGEISFDSWDSFESRVERSVETILSLLDAANTKATFFVLGWTAERNPRMVERIADRGHEIASHGYAHQLIYKETPDQFRADLSKSCAILEGITGKKVVSFRAPCFSITKDSLWALDILLEEGIRYDSSIFPIVHDRYGIPGCTPRAHVIRKNESAELCEIPLTVAQFGRCNIPFSGGGYFRLLPLFLTHYFTRRTIQSGIPVVVYLHPWEFDPDQPRVKTSALSTFRHYYGLKDTARKLKAFLSTYTFDSISGVMGEVR